MRVELAQLLLKVRELAPQRVLPGLGDAGMHSVRLAVALFEALEAACESRRLSLRDPPLMLVPAHVRLPSPYPVARARLCPAHAAARAPATLATT